MADGFGAPYENTDTLVLTSREGWFVDVRFSLAAGGGWDAQNGFWAFGGKATTTFPGEAPTTEGSTETAGGGGAAAVSKAEAPIPYLCHCVWAHEIDSKSADPASDEGDLVLLPDGGCLEYGVAPDPARGGALAMYKEYWVGVAGAKMDPCVVARCEDPVGLMVRIGEYCQGIMGVRLGAGKAANANERVRVGRWRRSPSGWDGDERNGMGDGVGQDGVHDGFLSMEWFGEDGRKVGEKKTIPTTETTWTVIEAST